jgi:molybdopterin-guanine dinucleotide biosynthesis protein B
MRGKALSKPIAVVGGKHSGKTTVIQHLIHELKRRGYRVGSAKEMVRTRWVDIQGRETWEHGKAGSEIVIAAPLEETVCFIKRRMSLNEMLTLFKGFDYVILEGFEKEKTVPKIIAAKDAEEAKAFNDGLAIAISGIMASLNEEVVKARDLNIPVFNCKTEIEKLADTVEEKAWISLPSLSHCGECGYNSCNDFAKAIVKGMEERKTCPLLAKEEVVMEVNGNRIPLKLFPRSFIKKTVLGMVSSLNGVGEVEEVRITIKT